jgi:hypothetical protein
VCVAHLARSGKKKGADVGLYQHKDSWGVDRRQGKSVCTSYSAKAIYFTCQWFGKTPHNYSSDNCTNAHTHTHVISLHHTFDNIL